MSMFSKDYKLNVNKSCDETLEIFRNNLDDMSKKGYSLSGNTVIRNSDHKSKYFSGEYKDGCFVIRQTDSGTDDFYFRLLPLHKISFEQTDGETIVSVKSSNKLALILFIVFLFVAIGLFALLYMLVSDGEVSKLLLLVVLVPLLLCVLDIIINARSITNTKDTLQYIFNK